MRKSIFAMLLAGTALMPVAHADDSSISIKGLPDTPAVNYLKKIGASFAYIGKAGDFDGYVSEVDGHKQIIYLIPGDPNHFIVGSVLDSDGHNLTLLSAHQEEEKLSDAIKQLQVIRDKASANAQGLDLTSNTAPAPNATATNPMPTKDGDVSSISTPPADVTNDSAPAETTKTTQTVVSNKKDAEVFDPAFMKNVVFEPGKMKDDSGPFIVDFDPKEFIADVTNQHGAKNQTANFTVGDENSHLPTVYMIADPQCPFCHAAWAQLHSIWDGKFNVEIILADFLPGSDKVVDQLLAHDNVGNLWLQGLGSKDGVLVTNSVPETSYAWKKADEYRTKNNDPFARKFQELFAKNGQTGVPVLAYVGADGKLRAREGVNVGENGLDIMKIFLSGLPAPGEKK